MRQLPRRTRRGLLIFTALGIVAGVVAAWLLANLFLDVIMPEQSRSSNATAYLASVEIAAGSTVQSSMVETVQMDEAVLQVGRVERDDPVRHDDEVVGHRALRLIRAGEQLYRGDFSP